MNVLRVFPRRTKATPDDKLVAFGPPGIFVPEIDKVHVSVTFTYDLKKAEILAKVWKPIAPVEIGGPATGTPPGDFVPGMYLKKGWVITSRGCPNKCLSGDTLVNTIEGDIPISQLVGKNIKVLTRDKNRKLIFADAINIRKVAENEKIVRVHFDNGKYIDCTPDHLFLKFKNGSQFVRVREYEVRSDQLKRGDSVVSFHTYQRVDGYVDITYGRKESELLHRLVMMGKLGRKLMRDEFVHHLDKNKQNNNLANLTLISCHDHAKLHPEIAQRMKLDNPTKYMTEKMKILWKRKISQSGLGKIRTPEQKLRYRESELGPKNPNYKPDKHKCINHKVEKVEVLPGKQDVYCLEVPGYNWFFANNIFVHNCPFCFVPKIEGELRELPITDGHILQDNNLLACSDKHIKDVFAMLKRQTEPLKLTGGMEAAKLKEWHAKALLDLKPQAIYFAYDLPKELEPLHEAGKTMHAAGFAPLTKSHCLRSYVLCGYKGDTFSKAEKRMMDTINAGFMPFAMLYRDAKGRTDLSWRKFQRFWDNPMLIHHIINKSHKKLEKGLFK